MLRTHWIMPDREYDDFTFINDVLNPLLKEYEKIGILNLEELVKLTGRKYKNV